MKFPLKNHFEEKEQKEKITKKEVVKSLIENPENLELLDKFLAQKEVGDKNEFEIIKSKANIFLEAGMKEKACSAFVDAAGQAAFLGRKDEAKQLAEMVISLKS
jgi:hypothetical protein